MTKKKNNILIPRRFQKYKTLNKLVNNMQNKNLSLKETVEIGTEKYTLTATYVPWEIFSSFCNVPENERYDYEVKVYAHSENGNIVYSGIFNEFRNEKEETIELYNNYLELMKFGNKFWE